jgi:hypothetical protein
VSRTVAIVAVIAVLAVVGVVIGVVVSGRPEQVTTRTYAKELCTTVLKPYARSAAKIVEGRAFERVLENDVHTRTQASEGAAAVGKLLDLYQNLMNRFQSYSDDHVMIGTDGKGFQQEVDQAIVGWKPDLDSARKDLDDVDVTDTDHVSKDLRAVLTDVGGLDISTSSDDPGGELLGRLGDADSSCQSEFRSMTSQGSGD